MSIISLLIPEALDGARVDAALRTLAPDLSIRRARRLADAGAVLRENFAVGARERVRAGDRLAFDAEHAASSIALGLRVVFEDDAVLVIEKPAGLAAHPGTLVADSVASRLPPGAGLAHRLDRLASGLLLIGKDAAALRALAAAMESGAIERTYLAFVVGAVEGDRTIDLPLRVTDEPRGDRPKVVVDPQAGEPARTHVRVLERFADATLLEVRLETGRTHQIRAHLRAIGHPLLGDPRYGDPARNAFARETFGVARPLLHAARLAFPLPGDGSRVALEASTPPDLARALGRIR